MLALFVGVQAFDERRRPAKRQKFADPINATVVNNDQTASLGVGHTQLLAAGEVRRTAHSLAILAGKQGLATNLILLCPAVTLPQRPAALIPLPGLPPGGRPHCRM
ncbi:MAG: hypothetical protein ACLVHY_05245 [Gemmiger sp.]